MIRISTCIVIITLVFLTTERDVAAGDKPGAFSPYVDSNGAMNLPAEFRSAWVHLGTWVLTSTLATGPNPGAASPRTGIHSVYAKSESLKSYRQFGKWPDGAVVVMEVRELKWDDLPTGHVIEEGEPLEWFVMVKDAKGRFPGNPNWGNGWGWALFKPAAPNKNVSTNYRNDCLSCHETAKETDGVFIQGYPLLRKEKTMK